MQNCEIDTPVNNLIELDGEMLVFTSGGTSSYIDPLGGISANADRGAAIDPNG